MYLACTKLILWSKTFVWVPSKTQVYIFLKLSIKLYASLKQYIQPGIFYQDNSQFFYHNYTVDFRGFFFLLFCP